LDWLVGFKILLMFEIRFNIHSFLFLGVFLLFNNAPLFSQSRCLVWQDEFSGSTIADWKWKHQIGTGVLYGSSAPGWGTGSIHYYTTDAANSSVSGGNLNITAKHHPNYIQETIQGTTKTYNHTSARLVTAGTFDFTYGRAAARIKLPVTTSGTWPAFWMLPTDIGIHGNWPRSGEIDIMELFGEDHSRVWQAIHYGNAWSGADKKSKGGWASLVSPAVYSNAFHDFELQWTPTDVKFYVDGALKRTVLKSTIEGEGYLWPFDKPFYLILQVAIDGDPETGDWLSGAPPAVYPDQTMQVDWVRVWQYMSDVTIKGEDKVFDYQTNVTYELPFVTTSPIATTWNWTVPAGVTLVSGQGTNKILVDFTGSTGGNKTINVEITNNCGTNTVSKSVLVIPDAPSVVIEDFENIHYIEPRGVTPMPLLNLTSGTFTKNVANPAPNTVNSSSICSKYVRSAKTQDELYFENTIIEKAADFVAGTKVLRMDVYTTAPVGSWIYLTLGDKLKSRNRFNYTQGRQCEFRVKTTEANAWHTITFVYNRMLDQSITDDEIDQMIIYPELWEVPAVGERTYYFDNIRIEHTSLSAEISPSAQKPESHMMLYPNPANDALQVVFEGDLADVTIFSMTGKELVKAQISSGSTLDLSSIPPGTYFAKVVSYLQGHQQKHEVRVFVKAD
jgi:beta-glucanase (GH16 family)